MTGRIYDDRQDAGQELAQALRRYQGRDDVIVLGLPRGGVPVAYVVARELGAPLDVLLVRKLGVPGHKEYAFGAIASGGLQVLNQGLVTQLGLSDTSIEKVVARETAELERRESLYRGERPFPDVQGKTVIVVDDGLATGSTMRAAAQALRKLEPQRLVAAVPTGASDSCMSLDGFADEVVCADMPSPFNAVGAWYRNFTQTSDEEVRRLLDQAETPG